MLTRRRARGELAAASWPARACPLARGRERGEGRAGGTDGRDRRARPDRRIGEARGCGGVRERFEPRLGGAAAEDAAEIEEREIVEPGGAGDPHVVAELGRRTVG